MFESDWIKTAACIVLARIYTSTHGAKVDFYLSSSCQQLYVKFESDRA